MVVNLDEVLLLTLIGMYWCSISGEHQLHKICLFNIEINFWWGIEEIKSVRIYFNLQLIASLVKLWVQRYHIKYLD